MAPGGGDSSAGRISAKLDHRAAASAHRQRGPMKLADRLGQAHRRRGQRRARDMQQGVARRLNRRRRGKREFPGRGDGDGCGDRGRNRDRCGGGDLDRGGNRDGGSNRCGRRGLDRSGHRHRCGVGLLDRRGKLDQRQAGRLASVARRGGDPEEARNLGHRLSRAGELHPVLHPRIDLVAGNVLPGDHARRIPIAGKGIGQCQILTDAGVGAGVARGGLEHCNRFVGMAGERERKARVRCIDHRRGAGDQLRGIVAPAQRDLGQRELEHDLRLVLNQRQRIAERLFGRAKAAGGEVAIAKQGAEAGVGRAMFDRALGERGGGGNVVGGKRHLGLGREPDVGAVDFPEQSVAGHRLLRTWGRAGGKCADQPNSGQCRADSDRLHHDKLPRPNWPFSSVRVRPCRRARASSSTARRALG